MTPNIVLVTGAGSGIGRAIAQKFAERGDTVAAVDLNTEAVEAVASASNGSIHAFTCDVSDRGQVEALRDAVTDAVGAPTVLVNAAGWDRTDKFLNATAEFAEKVVAINYMGPVHIASVFLPAIVEAGGGGRLINLASDAGRVGSSGETIYAGAKGGVIALTKSLAIDHADQGIRANCVTPGPILTPLMKRNRRPEEIDYLAKMTLVGRIGMPNDIAATIAFLSSEDGEFINGEIINVAGGRRGGV